MVGSAEITVDNNIIAMNIKEDKSSVFFKKIAILKKGQGYGSKIINAIKEYWDETDKVLFIEDVVNVKFFKKFGLQKDGQDWIYVPKWLFL